MTPAVNGTLLVVATNVKQAVQSGSHLAKLHSDPTTFSATATRCSSQLRCTRHSSRKLMAWHSWCRNAEDHQRHNFSQHPRYQCHWQIRLSNQNSRGVGCHYHYCSNLFYILVQRHVTSLPTSVPVLCRIVHRICKPVCWLAGWTLDQPSHILQTLATVTVSFPYTSLCSPE